MQQQPQNKDRLSLTHRPGSMVDVLKKSGRPRSAARIFPILATGTILLYFLWWRGDYSVKVIHNHGPPGPVPDREQMLMNTVTPIQPPTFSTRRHERVFGAKISTVYGTAPTMTMTVTVQQPLAPTVTPTSVTASRTETTKEKETEVIKDPRTLVFRRRELQKIWLWEVASGHYPTARRIPHELDLIEPPLNPAVPRQGRGSLFSSRGSRTPAARNPELFALAFGRGTGLNRTYLDIEISPKLTTHFPIRPLPQSVADFDVIMDHCDFSRHKFVRDCLEFLRAGAGLDMETRVRRAKMDKWRYLYTLDPKLTDSPIFTTPIVDGKLAPALDDSLILKRGVDIDGSIDLPAIRTPYPSIVSSAQPCDPERPRIFHTFWAGPFTDKPYHLLMSFLFTQNLGLHDELPDPTICRPQYWIWIKLGSAFAENSPTALDDMFDTLAANPWSSPFLHPRFRDVIKFKLWDTQEQLDGVPEIKDEWRLQPRFFNAAGHVYVPKNDADSKAFFNRVGSKSQDEYDRLSVILSDMARFVLTHRFGGIYLDADTIFLRDWTELWNWTGAFAYRWSRLAKYNTAVLKLNKGSALGTFLFRTALKNGLDFHPMSVSTYVEEAYLEPLLFRLPDALFDPAWLTSEDYQRERPPMPNFTEFKQFFLTPTFDAALPQAAGFDHFFRGAFSYHFHNQWWTPFDASRNWPDLGPRFAEAEQKARIIAAQQQEQKLDDTEADNSDEEERLSDDLVDLPWTAVLKRTFEGYIRGERPNMYGEFIRFD